LIELGELLKTTREEAGVGLTEASMDLNIDVLLLENIESGNTKAFKDIYKLRDYVLEYAKYLGLDIDNVNDAFNDYLFDKTSKIKLSDIKEEKQEETKKIMSPYTKEYTEKKDIKPIILLIVGVIIISIIICLIIVGMNLPENRDYELISGGIYELS